MTQAAAGERAPDVPAAGVDALLDPRSIAVLGASGDPSRIGGIVVSLLRRFGFPGNVFAVNPKYDEVQGFPCYPSIKDIPEGEQIDLAIVYLPLVHVVDAVRDCGERGVRGVVVISAGFAEVGGDGVTLQAELAHVAREYGMALSGPNCAGIANFLRDFVAYGSTNFIDLASIERGPVALLTCSGGFGNTIFTYCQERHVGLSHLVGLGNEAVSTASDFLGELVEHPGVEVVLGLLEGVRDPDGFVRAAERAADLGKPVVVLKSGRSEAGRHSIMTHTAALGGSPEAYAGTFRQHGVIQVFDLDELADMAMMLTRSTPAVGSRVGIFSLPGGGTSLLSDLAGDHGFTVPELAPETVAGLQEILPPIAVPKNPLDPTAGFGRESEKLQEALRRFAADPSIDVVVFFPLASQVDYSLKLAEDLVAVAPDLGKPVICIWTAGRQLEDNAWRRLHSGGVPLFTQTEPAFRALARARDYARFLERRRRADAADFGPRFEQGPPDPDTTAPLDLLRHYGIRTPRTGLARSPGEAADLAAEFGGPVAVKIASPDIAHKTEVGGVRLGVAPEDAASAYEAIMRAARSAVEGARIDGVEVQEMVPDGVEMLLGVTTDDQLGPILTVGTGGIFAEAFRDAAHARVPVSRAEAQHMLTLLDGATLLDGFRGRPPADRAALVEAMLALSALAWDLRARRPEIDVNPVVVLPEGAVAVDALVRLES